MAPTVEETIKCSKFCVPDVLGSYLVLVTCWWPPIWATTHCPVMVTMCVVTCPRVPWEAETVTCWGKLWLYPWTMSDTALHAPEWLIFFGQLVSWALGVLAWVCMSLSFAIDESVATVWVAWGDRGVGGHTGLPITIDFFSSSSLMHLPFSFSNCSLCSLPPLAEECPCVSEPDHSIKPDNSVKPAINV